MAIRRRAKWARKNHEKKAVLAVVEGGVVALRVDKRGGAAVRKEVVGRSWQQFKEGE
jgi:hypothetical protein